MKKKKKLQYSPRVLYKDRAQFLDTCIHVLHFSFYNRARRACTSSVILFNYNRYFDHSKSARKTLA